MKKLLPYLSQLMHVSKQELIAILILVAGASGGYILNKQSDNSERELSDFRLILDSLILENEKEMKGTNIFDQAIEPDTIKETPLIVNINTGSKTELMSLPGVGPKTALKIIAYRRQQKFEETAEIMNIKGIGPKKYAKIKMHIRTK